MGWKWDGNGTENNPYRIEGYHLVALGPTGIKISNTDVYFVIENCLVELAINTDEAGISLSSANNGLIINNTIRDNTFGIKISGSKNNSIVNNTISNNNNGIDLWDNSNSNQISFNFIQNSATHGIMIVNSNFNNITRNELLDNGYGIVLSSAYFTTMNDNMFYNNKDGSMNIDGGSNNLEIDTFAPSLMGPMNQSFELGAIPLNLAWFAKDGNPANYKIYRNNVEIATGTWAYNVPITYTNTEILSVDLYNFTIEVRDLSNHLSSHTLWVNFTDTTPPEITDISHTPVLPVEYDNITITAMVTDNYEIEIVLLFYRVNGGEWQNITMITTSNDYDAMIGSFAEETTIEYYIFAHDTMNNSAQSTSMQFTVLENLPIAVFSVNSTSVFEGEWIQFTEESHHGELPYTYEWDFGDGSANSTQQNPIHQFDIIGTFWVTLTIYDVNGKSNSTAIQINVLEPITEDNDPFSSIDGYNGLIMVSLISIIGVLWVSSRKRRNMSH